MARFSPVLSTTVDFDLGRDFEPSSWSMNAELATDLPEQIREAPGLSVASGTVTLSPPVDAKPGHFSPFRRGGSMKLANKRITLSFGVDGDPVPILGGKVVAASGSATGEDLTVEVEDAYSDLRDQV